ncbi:energy transducer TonB [Marinoscillum furvescens]|uniref:TonB family protein n=1 Tax=Marinoscillum furvescens DSM 4134 TaxID=1122208 RepID=A0A3D9KXH3_MARFU|nr:energy transducer TonB [Marinoscillum furvescens]RED93204.1 TonB family protein [Marinoscillum furvescens DSM 4134]
MRRYITLLGLVFTATLAFASSDPNYVVMPKALNMEAVARTISYPASSNTAGIEGKVLLYVEIDAKGEVTKTTTLSAPCSKLKTEAENAAKKLKFEPARNSAGEAVASGVRIPFEFELTIE